MVQTKRGRGRPRKNNGEVTMVEENIVVSEEDVEVIPEVVEEELPMGHDPSILYAGREEHCKGREIVAIPPQFPCGVCEDVFTVSHTHCSVCQKIMRIHV